MFDYDQGYRDGIKAYAWWKDGKQMVGNCGKTLEDADKNRIATWNYGPVPSGYPDPGKCPEDIVEDLTRYRDHGVPVGTFLRAVLCNDLAEAFGKADVSNCEALGHIIAWVYANMPAGVWHNAERVDSHVKAWAEERQQAQDDADQAEQDARNEG